MSMDEHVLIDAGVKAVTVDGVYLIGSGNGMFLRKVTKQLSGGWLIQTPNSNLEAARVDSLKGIRAAGRVVMAWKCIVL